MAPGRYRLTGYAWDFAGNRSALDYSFHFPVGSTVSVPATEYGPPTHISIRSWSHTRLAAHRVSSR
jgi:hypothetical protein